MLFNEAYDTVYFSLDERKTPSFALNTFNIGLKLNKKKLSACDYLIPFIIVERRSTTKMIMRLQCIAGNTFNLY
jgi:hypothetical protein